MPETTDPAAPVHEFVVTAEFGDNPVGAVINADAAKGHEHQVVRRLPPKADEPETQAVTEKTEGVVIHETAQIPGAAAVPGTMPNVPLPPPGAGPSTIGAADAAGAGAAPTPLNPSAGGPVAAGA